MEPDSRKRIPNVLRKRRRQKGLTQAQAARKLGVSRWLLIQWERGKKMPGGDALLALSALYNVLPTDLYFDRFKEICAEIAQRG